MTKIESYKGRRRQPGSLSGSRQSTKGGTMPQDNVTDYLAVEAAGYARLAIAHRAWAAQCVSDGFEADAKWYTQQAKRAESGVIESANRIIARRTAIGESHAP